MFIITANHNGMPYYIKGTISVGDAYRAQQFETKEAAQEQMEKASKFHKKSYVKTWKIEQV
jgi:hypothetical protein